MAQLDVTAVAMDHAEDVILVVSVVDDDGLLCAELPATAFAVQHLTSTLDAADGPCSVVATREGPSGVYRLRLAPTESSSVPPGPTVFAVVVAGPTEGGWSDDHGQTLAFGSRR